MKALINKIKINDVLLENKIVELLNKELKHNKLVYVKFKKIEVYKKDNKTDYKTFHKDIKEKIFHSPYKYLKKDDLITFYCLLDKNLKYDLDYEEIKLENLKEEELAFVINFLFETLVREELKKIKNDLEFQGNTYILIDKKTYLKEFFLLDTLKVNISFDYSLKELLINLNRKCFKTPKKDIDDTTYISLENINYAIINQKTKKLDATKYSKISYMNYTIDEVQKTIVYCQNFIQDLFIKYFNKYNINYEKMYFENQDSKNIKINNIDDKDKEILLVNNIQNEEIKEFSYNQLNIIKEAFHMINMNYELYKNGQVISSEDITTLSNLKNKKILFLSNSNIKFSNKEISFEQALDIFDFNENNFFKLDIYTKFKIKNLLYKKNDIIFQNILVVNEKNEDIFEKVFKNENKLSDVFITSINELKIKTKLTNYYNNYIFSFDFDTKDKKFSTIYIKSKNFKRFNVETLNDSEKYITNTKIIKINFKIEKNKLYIENIEDLSNSDDFHFDYHFIKTSLLKDKNKIMDNQFYLIDEESKDFCYINTVDETLPIIIGNDKVNFIDCINQTIDGTIKINKRNLDSKLALPKGKISLYENTYLLPFINSDKKTKEFIHIENHENYSNYFINRDKNSSNNKIEKYDRIHKVVWKDKNNEDLKDFKQKDIYDLFFSLFTSNVIKTKENNAKTLLPEKLSMLYLNN